MGTKNGKWDGKGSPPSREAAVEWLIEEHGFLPGEADSAVRLRGGKTILGADARRAVSVFNETKRKADERRTEGAAADAPMVADVDVNKDGRIDATEVAGIAEEDIFGAGPGAPDVDPRGAALWPYAADPTTLDSLTVRDRSTTGQHAEDSRFGNLRTDRQRGARYFEQDTLEPLRWSTERRADLQRVMQGLGLYGEDQIRLGVWTAKDQDVYATILANANVEGLTWHELLSKWRVSGLPPDIAQQLEAEKAEVPPKPTLRVTNPLDIQAVGRATAQSLIGRNDPTFGQELVAGYQQAEKQAQQGVYDDQEAGGGGTITEQPSLQAFAEDQMERRRPVEVDSYATLGSFNEMLRMLGAAG